MNYNAMLSSMPVPEPDKAMKALYTSVATTVVTLPGLTKASFTKEIQYDVQGQVAKDRKVWRGHVSLDNIREASAASSVRRLAAAGITFDIKIVCKPSKLKSLVAQLKMQNTPDKVAMFAKELKMMMDSDLADTLPAAFKNANTKSFAAADPKLLKAFKNASSSAPKAGSNAPKAGSYSSYMSYKAPTYKPSKPPLKPAQAVMCASVTIAAAMKWPKAGIFFGSSDSKPVAKGFAITAQSIFCSTANLCVVQANAQTVVKGTLYPMSKAQVKQGGSAANRAFKGILCNHFPGSSSSAGSSSGASGGSYPSAGSY